MNDSLRFLWMPALAGIALLACSPPPPPENPNAGELPLVVPSGSPAALPEPAPSAEPSAAPTASASASAEAKAPPAGPSLPEGCSRPPFLKTDEKEVTDTVGVSPCAKFVVGPEGETAVLRIPENALTQGVNITFKVDLKAKGTGVQIGKIYHLMSIVPPSGTPDKIVSAGLPFVLQLPAGNKKDANLAIGEVTGGSVKWKVIAPKSIDDVTSMATYEITELGDLLVHVTTKAVTTPK